MNFQNLTLFLQLFILNFLEFSILPTERFIMKLNTRPALPEHLNNRSSTSISHARRAASNNSKIPRTLPPRLSDRSLNVRAPIFHGSRRCRGCLLLHTRARPLRLVDHKIKIRITNSSPELLLTDVVDEVEVLDCPDDLD